MVDAALGDVWLYIALAVIVAATAFFFIALSFTYTEQVIATISIFLSLFTTFGILINFLTSREMHTPYLVLLIMSIGIFTLVNYMAVKELTPYATYANSLATHYSLDDISSIIDSISSFYKGLTGAQIAYFSLLVIAYIGIFWTSITALLAFLFYSTAAQISQQSSQLAWTIVNHTCNYSKKGYFWFMFASILFAFFVFNGEVYIYGIKALHALARFSR